MRSYIPEKKQKGRRHWQGKAEEQQAYTRIGGGCAAVTARACSGGALNCSNAASRIAMKPAA
jgi:hypothetical protein